MRGRSESEVSRCKAQIERTQDVSLVGIGRKITSFAQGTCECEPMRGVSVRIGHRQGSTSRTWGEVEVLLPLRRPKHRGSKLSTVGVPGYRK